MYWLLEGVDSCSSSSYCDPLYAKPKRPQVLSGWQHGFVGLWIIFDSLPLSRWLAAFQRAGATSYWLQRRYSFKML
jgi:hypothetical protein